MESSSGRGPFAAAVAGAGAGILGGLLGLGGAEFRLPLLVTIFRYTLRRAVSLNLAISFVAVVVAAASRWVLAEQAPLASATTVAVCMMVGGMAGAALGSRWLARLSDERLHTAVRTLLVSIGLLLIIESVTPWTATGLSVSPIGRHRGRARGRHHRRGKHHPRRRRG
jgi:uncharacterized protein